MGAISWFLIAVLIMIGVGLLDSYVSARPTHFYDSSVWDDKDDWPEFEVEDYVPILLIDMDGVIADYYGYFCQVWAAKYPGRKILTPAELTHMYFEKSYGPEFVDDIRAITTGVGFFENLPPMKYSAEVLNMILDGGQFRPFLCSTPDSDSEDHCCPSEKMRWVESVLGKRWLKRIILTHDKTLVHGDYLIDDKPDIHGANPEPSWEHIVFTHNYNLHLDNYRLDSWLGWFDLQHELLDN